MLPEIALPESAHPRCQGELGGKTNLRQWPGWLAISLLAAMLGCGTTRSYTATEQLLMSDAVDATVSKIDFSPLAGKKVFLDTSYMKMMKAPNILLDTDYVASSIRQQMVADSVCLVDSRDEAELIAEARLGTMGLDGHSVTYGVPASNALSGASMLTGNPMPALPELSLGRREAKLGAAKVAVFAYKRVTREPYWQSGISRASSTARDTWFLGIGPWQEGTIYEGTRFAGTRTSRTPGVPNNRIPPRGPAFEDFRGTRLFAAALEEQQLANDPTRVAQASGATNSGGATNVTTAGSVPASPTNSAPTASAAPVGQAQPKPAAPNTPGLPATSGPAASQPIASPPSQPPSNPPSLPPGVPYIGPSGGPINVPTGVPSVGSNNKTP